MGDAFFYRQRIFILFFDICSALIFIFFFFFLLIFLFDIQHCIYYLDTRIKLYKLFALYHYCSF